METLKFEIEINAPRKKVWETMFQADTYKKWVDVSWPGSYYEGTWKQGEDVRFISPGQGGTMAKLVEHKPYEETFAEHVAVVLPDGTLDRDSTAAKGWIGTTERYTFRENDGKTKVIVSIKTTPEWLDMFNDGWPAALKKLKELCESK